MSNNALAQPCGLYAFQEESFALLTGVLNVPKAISYLLDDKGKPYNYRIHQLHPSMHREYLNTYYQYDPLHPARFIEGDAKVVKMSDLVSSQEQRELPYFTDFISPWGVRDIVEVFLRLDNRLTAGFALFNLSNQPEIDNAYIQRVSKLCDFMHFSLEQCIDSPKNNEFEQFCRSHNLTNKEQLVVELVTQGLPNKTIANNLECSLATIKTHLQHIFQKLGINSKNELISTLYKKH